MRTQTKECTAQTYNDFIRGKQFDLYDLATSYKEEDKLLINNKDIILSDLAHNIVYEAIRKVLHLPIMSDKFYNTFYSRNKTTIGYDIHPIRENVSYNENNEFKQIEQYIDYTKDGDYSKRQETRFNHVYLITGETKGNAFLVTAIEIKKWHALINQRDNEFADEKMRRIADSQYDRIANLASNLSLDKKKELIKKLSN